MTPPVAYHDLRDRPGRALVVGDIHGCFDLLRAALDRIGFDPARDTLFLLGDLVDRGPQSLECLEWLHHPRVRGNHEVMTANALAGGRKALFHIDNGGAWFAKLGPGEQVRYAAALVDAPFAIDLITPAGHHVGLVHADLPGNDWNTFLATLASTDETDARADAEDRALWGRSRIGTVTPGEATCDTTIAGVDHVFFGHSVVLDPVTAGNCSWIDVGSSATQQLCLIDIDDWLARGGARITWRHRKRRWGFFS